MSFDSRGFISSLLFATGFVWGNCRITFGPCWSAGCSEFVPNSCWTFCFYVKGEREKLSDTCQLFSSKREWFKDAKVDWLILGHSFDLRQTNFFRKHNMHHQLKDIWIDNMQNWRNKKLHASVISILKAANWLQGPEGRPNNLWYTEAMTLNSFKWHISHSWNNKVQSYMWIK